VRPPCRRCAGVPFGNPDMCAICGSSDRSGLLTRMGRLEPPLEIASMRCASPGALCTRPSPGFCGFWPLEACSRGLWRFGSATDLPTCAKRGPSRRSRARASPPRKRARERRRGPMAPPFAAGSRPGKRPDDDASCCRPGHRAEGWRPGRRSPAGIWQVAVGHTWACAGHSVRGRRAHAAGIAIARPVWTVERGNGTGQGRQAPIDARGGEAATASAPQSAPTAPVGWAEGDWLYCLATPSHGAIIDDL
jgi:hypothetical protein